MFHSIGNGTIKTTTGSGGFGINTGYNVNPRCALEVDGIVYIHNNSPYAVINNPVVSGSLTIGGIMLIMVVVIIGLLVQLGYCRNI